MPAAPNSFARTLSLTVHELRTPITVVSGYLRMLLKEVGGPLTDKQRGMIGEAERSCARISALVQEMSDLGRLEAGETVMSQQDVDIAAILQSLVSSMPEIREAAERGVHLELRSAERPLVVVGDPVRIGSVLRALVHSALRERGEPGVIVANCSVSPTPNASVLVTIGDEETQQMLLAPAPDTPSFDEWRGGMGLALPLASRVVTALGGALWDGPGPQPRAGCVLRLPIKNGSAQP